MSLGEKLKQARLSMGLTQQEVADGIGVSLRTYRNYEYDATLPRTRDLYQRLADFFAVEVDYLLSENDQFVLAAAEKYGYRGRRDAKEIVGQIVGLFAGGELSDSDRDQAMQAIQQAYWDAKENNQKFTPGKHQDQSR